MSAGFTEGYNQLCPNLFKACLFGVFLGQTYGRDLQSKHNVIKKHVNAKFMCKKLFKFY